MRIWGRARAKWDELLGRAEELYGQSHGDAAATAGGEALRLEGEYEEQQQELHERLRPPRPDDDRHS